MPKKKAVRSRRESNLRPPFPMSVVLYGQSGSGKTSLAARFPRPGFIIDSQERGIEFLSKSKQAPDPVWIQTLDVEEASSWPKLISSVIDAARDAEIETLVLESVTGWENICFLYHCEQQFDGDFSANGFYNRWKGPKNAARFEWPRFMGALDLVLDSGKNVVVTAHSRIKEEADPQGVSVMRYVPYCEGDTWARLHRWASAVFFLGTHIEEDKKKGGLKSVAKSVYDRLIFVEGTPYCEAKNWFGLHGVIPMGDTADEAYKNLMLSLNRGGK